MGSSQEAEMWGASPRRARLLVGTAVVMVGVAVMVSAASGRERPSASGGELAARLVRLDPGARVGGNTQVATAAGARVLGVGGRVNFVVALGARERIVGGAGHDELGARGAADRVYGGGGDDLIHGGRGHVLDGGPGNDLIIDTEGGATVRTGPGHDRVIVAGRGRADRVACSAGSHDTLIYADHGDTIAPTCGQRHARVRYRPPPTMSPRPARAAQAVSGDGSNETPSSPAATTPARSIAPPAPSRPAPSPTCGRTSTSLPTNARMITPTSSTRSTRRSARPCRTASKSKGSGRSASPSEASSPARWCQAA
jgi:hypothetical protein